MALNSPMKKWVNHDLCTVEMRLNSSRSSAIFGTASLALGTPKTVFHRNVPKRVGNSMWLVLLQAVVCGTHWDRPTKPPIPPAVWYATRSILEHVDDIQFSATNRQEVPKVHWLS